MPHRPECRFSKAFSRSKQEHMTEKTTPREKLTEADYRKKRLAEQLRANLMRRKANPVRAAQAKRMSAMTESPPATARKNRRNGHKNASLKMGGG